MSFVLKISCTMVMLAASASAIANEMTDLSVTGTVMTRSCEPSLSGGGVINYGNLNDTLGAEYVVLKERTMQLSIVCGAKTKVAIKAVSGRLGSALARSGEDNGGFGMSYVQLAWGADPNLTKVVGLGFDASGNKIGGVALNMKQGITVIDGSTNVDIWESFDNGWRTKNNSRTMSGARYTWVQNGSSEPLAFSSMRTELNVQAYLNLKNNLDITQRINLDGLIAFEIIYL